VATTDDRRAERVRHYYAPEELRNGREVGAWCYGLACGVHCEEAGDDAPIVTVEMLAEHADGAACAIVGAGGSVARSQYEDRPLLEGRVALVVSLGVAITR
jgi:hypothetical protein